MDKPRKQHLKHATRAACAAFTDGMDAEQLRQRLADVQAKIAASTDRDGKPRTGLSERVEACREEAARLQSLL